MCWVERFAHGCFGYWVLRKVEHHRIDARRCWISFTSPLVLPLIRLTGGSYGLHTCERARRYRLAFLNVY